MNAAKTRLTFLEGQARAFDCKAAKKLNYFKNLTKEQIEQMFKEDVYKKLKIEDNL